MLNVLEQLPLHDDACVTALVHVAVQDILTGPIGFVHKCKLCAVEKMTS